MLIKRGQSPQSTMGLLSLVCFAMLGFGLYLQHGVGLNPCPMCIVQRYALLFVAVTSGITWATRQKSLLIIESALILAAAFFGAFVAARQTWLQWYPPQEISCGRDFYGMIESFPLSRVVPMIFKGSGDCSAIDWTFLGGSLANWSFISFTVISLLAIRVLWRLFSAPRLFSK